MPSVIAAAPSVVFEGCRLKLAQKPWRAMVNLIEVGGKRSARAVMDDAGLALYCSTAEEALVAAETEVAWLLQ